MTAHQQTTVAALENQAFALMGRLHVILRRQSGRITDIEYMRADPAYCRHVLQLALQTPAEDAHRICEKLQEIYFGNEGLFVRNPPKAPLAARFGSAAAAAKISHAPGDNTTSRLPDEDVDRAYIGRLR
ncbi:MAG TPA: hypothetical protein VGU61_07305 [Noviherbaspirillum sp.]|jgi:hypothetical protein|uniref:hypothetical protein n=1 Tax=Noviherbaspirillum sp. TaxID=1926288 RepID=UPI002DDD8338|nr:hypothetical protein [Noviherbaspirillum sp.]HEV2610059.1 hypothetical protein [Noviherbaspirillum sp.]